MFELFLNILIAVGGISSIFILGTSHSILVEKGKSGLIAFTPYGFYIYVVHIYTETGKVGFWFWPFFVSILGLIVLGFAWLFLSM